MEYLMLARAWLETNVHPAAWLALQTLAIWLLIYAARKHAPAWWSRLELISISGSPASKMIQAVPAVLLGALLETASSGGDYHAAWRGALAGAMAPLFHHLLRVLPIPYQGETGPRND